VNRPHGGTVATDLDTPTTSTAPIPVELERDLAEVGLIVAAAADTVHQAIVLPLALALRLLQEVNATPERRYVGEQDRSELARRVRAARYPAAA